MKAVYSGVIICTMVLMGTGVPAPALANGCIECHSSSDFYVQDRKLYNYYQDFIKSPHSDAGLTCDFCHGGDAEAADRESAHASIPQITDPANKLYYQNLPETCGACHTEKLVQFKQSKHYKNLMNDSVAPSCTTCHSAMKPRPNYRDIVDDSCRNCHNTSNADAIPLIADQADEFLYRLSIGKVYLGWTTEYYESQGWPGSSQQQIKDLSRQYGDAVTRVHSFDISKMDESSAEILEKLTAMFERGWEEKINQEVK